MKTKQRTDRRGRVLRTAAKRHELIGEWQSSGLSKVEFCARHGVNPTTFSTWSRAAKAKSRGKPKQKVEFAEFKMDIGGMAPIEVELPNGVKIRLRDSAICRGLMPAICKAAPC